MAKQIQTTFTFTSNEAANLFCAWLRKFYADSDYGCPRFIDKRSVSMKDDWCVEYIYDNTKQGHIVSGVALGIEASHQKIALSERAACADWLDEASKEYRDPASVVIRDMAARLRAGCVVPIVTDTITFKCLSRNTAGLTTIYDFLAADGECWRCERQAVDCGAEDFKQGDMIGVPAKNGIPQWHEKFTSATRMDSQ
jgi:hypothetical protein